ncbi:hypothetical protein E4U61_001804 [Claviceps capensis]|nr:hypothetical protein E4U61_001804 [Claviceps capensis]
MGSVARQAYFMAWKQELYDSKCLMTLLSPEIRSEIISYLSPEPLSRLGQSCRTWYQLAIPELYARDAKEGGSYAIKWMAAHAVDEETTEVALKTLDISARYGGQVNAIQLEFPQHHGFLLNYERSTALHYAVVLRNLCVTQKLLDMGARHDIPCSGVGWVWKATQSPRLMQRIDQFKGILEVCFRLSSWMPIFLAFIQSDQQMGQLLLEHGAGREAVILRAYGGQMGRVSILHFAAADTTRDIDQWQLFFDAFREYINEPCARLSDSPLHVALSTGCIQGMQLAVQTGADMEKRNALLETPLTKGVQKLRFLDTSIGALQRHITCLRRFVELGGSVNPEGDSLLVSAVRYYRENPIVCPDVRVLIDFFLDHGADINEVDSTGSTVFNELIDTILSAEAFPPAIKVLEKLLSHLVDRGLDLTRPAPFLPSPLSTVMHNRDAQPAWLFKFLYRNGATIKSMEEDAFFLRWCQIPRLWGGIQYGRYDIRQQAAYISRSAAFRAYKIAFSFDTSHLYKLLVRMPLIAPLKSEMAGLAFLSNQKWSWKKIVSRKAMTNLIEPNEEENLLHRTVRIFQKVLDYSAADAIEDISELMRRGLDITATNRTGYDPLELYLHLGCDKADGEELLVFLEREMERACDLQIQRQLGAEE